MSDEQKATEVDNIELQVIKSSGFMYLNHTATTIYNAAINAAANVIKETERLEQYTLAEVSALIASFLPKEAPAAVEAIVAEPVVEVPAVETETAVNETVN